MSTSLKIGSLNMGRGLEHLNKSLEFLANCDWEIACLQDLRKDHLPYIKRIFKTGEHFVPMAKHLFDGRRIPVGIGVFSRELPFLSTMAYAYVGNISPILNLEGDGEPRDLQKIRQTESRVLAVCEIKKNKSYFKIGTTHGIWVPQGKTDNFQRKGTKNFLSVVTKAGDLILAGDFNAPRGSKIYSMLTKQLNDQIPVVFNNSIDPALHSLRGKIKILVDYFFTTSGIFRVSNIEMTFGVSDHAAVCGIASSLYSSE